MQKQVTVEEALARKYPEQVVVVTTRAPDGRPNAMAVGWVMVASGDPPMWALGIDEGAYTYELITSTRQFVVAFPHAGMGREVLYVGSMTGRGRDKLAECGLVTQPATRVRAPLLADAVANFECELVTIVKPGDAALVVGRVVAAHINTDASLTRLYAIARGHVLAGVTPCGPPVADTGAGAV